MQFRIADTFTSSLARLSADEQKAAKTTAFDLQVDPSHPGLSFHRLDRAKDKNFWSVRVGSDVRLIVHRTDDSLLLCYVDHHDKAYHWAERRKLETHPKTGAAQFVEIRERVEEASLPPARVRRDGQSPSRLSPNRPLFAKLADDELSRYGVPSEWFDDVRGSDEDSILELAEHLPAEAAEALLVLATGGTPDIATPERGGDPFQHPDALRRFRIIGDVEALRQALEYPWDRWTVFLHPAQKQYVERTFKGPARVAGSAGTGKTIVALHRAVHLARTNADARVLLTTFSEPLANALDLRLRRLISSQPRLAELIEVCSLNAIGERLYGRRLGPLAIADDALIDRLLNAAAAATSPQIRFAHRFIRSEWDDVVDAGQLGNWEAYRDVKRLGRKTRLSEAQRKQLWEVFASVQAALRQGGQITRAQMFTKLAEDIRRAKAPPFDHVVVDEAQDLTVAQLRFVASLGSIGTDMRPNSLFFAGDLGQRIFQQPFSWKSLGVDVRGRSKSLHVNYRTSHQIRAQADRLLGPEVADVDGITEERRGTVSVFNGAEPEIRTFKRAEDESAAVAQWLKARVGEGVLPQEIAVFVRSDRQIDRAKAALKVAGLPFRVLDARLDTVAGQVSVSTMHLAKGLEFRAVAVMGCDDDVIPLQERIAAIVDESDLEEVYNSERHLLYVACTRARDYLLVTSAEPASEFLTDLHSK